MDFMLIKKTYTKIFFVILVLAIITSVFIYIYRKPIQVHKSYTGIIKDIKSDKITGKSNITLDINYTKAYKIKNFKSIDSIDGSINIDNIDYNIEGITVLNDKENYIGATASQNGKSKLDLLYGSLAGLGIGWMVVLRDLSSMAQCPSGNW